MYDKLYHGAAYYPELWDAEVIKEDIKWMKEAGINVVRMGEFAWATMEPEKDKINLDFFEEIVNLLYQNGIETILCTPTPTPPVWLTHNHPKRMFVDKDGTVMSHGARQQICTNNRHFRERSDIIVKAMAQRFADNPAVIAWQLDNEFKCHVAECYCETCKKLWHEWLQKKYGTIDALNEAWGADIWSERYQTFEQVPQPVKTPFVHNSSLNTMYQLFHYEKIVEFAETQEKIIRKYSKAPITHNGHTDFSLDNYLLFKNLDFASFDDYPNCDNYCKMLYNYDYFRSVKNDGRFWVMETSTSHNGCLIDHQKPHRTGFLTAEAVAAYAAGGMGFNYWLWRQQKSGCEQPHGSLMSAWGKPTIGFNEVKKVEQARKEISSVILSTTVKQADVAITYSAEARAFYRTEPYEGIDYLTEIEKIHEIVVGQGLSRDVVSDDNPIEGYKLLITPFLPHVKDQVLERALALVEQGATWIVGPMTGMRTGEHTVPTDHALGKLEEAVGVNVIYHFPISDTGASMVYDGVEAELCYFASVFEPNGVRVIAKTQGGVAPDLPVIVEVSRGKGTIVMLGAMPKGDAGKQLLGRLISDYAVKAGAGNYYRADAGTIVYERCGDGEEYVIAINMDGKGGSISFSSDYRDLETGHTVNNTVGIGAYQYKIFQKLV